MNTAVHRSPTCLPAPSGTRIGSHRHFPAVTPFVRSHYALTRLNIAEGDTRRQRQSQDAMQALLDDLRRAVDASGILA